MSELERHEQFEMLVLDELRKIKLLDQLVFGGGTMLRLCHDLPRFSVDFDFYLKKTRREFLPWAKTTTAQLQAMGAELTDHQEKRNSFLWELRMRPYPRRLKIEIRKQLQESRHSELTIAHSAYSPLQVRLRALTLEQMWQNKINALIDRNEIRDAYDLEFLTRRNAGDFTSQPLKTLRKIHDRLEAYTTQDYRAKLGPILPATERRLVLSNKFSYLKAKITALITD